MKKIKGLSIFLTCILLLSGCDLSSGSNRSKDKYEEGYYIVGRGSFNSGVAYSLESAILFDELETENEDIYCAYQKLNVSFSIGDVFKIEHYPSENYLNYYDLESEAFNYNNFSRSSSDQEEIQVLKSGNYNLYIVMYNSGLMTIDCTLGDDTEPNSSLPINTKINIDIFANGDQHGVVEANSSYASYPTYVSYIKDTMSEYEYPLLLSNGDLWQGTYESNINYGKLLTDCLDDAGYVSMTLGNHEFDWGEEAIKENKEISGVPFLGANIVKYDISKRQPTDELVDYVDPYTIVEVGPLNIGIIGVIGPDQWSSITSKFVQDVYFLDPEDVIKEYSDLLRVDFNCQIVIASFHAGTSDSRAWITSLGNTSPVSGEPYINAAFTSHDHNAVVGKINGVPYANSGTKDAYLSHITLTYDNGSISGNATNINTSSSNLSKYSEDKEIRTIIDSYIDDNAKVKADEIEGTLSSSFGRYCDNSDNYGPRLAAKAMYEYCVSENYYVDCAFVNDARAVLPAGEVSYANILEAFPFFNETTIMSVTGRVLKNEVRYANSSVVYYAPTGFTINDNKTYTVAAYDYLAYHCNSNSRNYNYFTEFTEIDSLPMWPVDYISSYMNSFSGSITKDSFPDYNYNCIS